MAQVNFPDTTGQPTDGTFQYTENNVTYSWNGIYWSANNASSLDDRFVNVSGDTMTGDLTVPNLISQGDVQTTSLNGGQIAGMRNAIINGDFRVIQRLTGYNASHNVTLNVSQYFADRWAYLSPITGTVRVNTQNTFPYYKMRQASGVSGLRQCIELPSAGFAGPYQQGTTWTLSVYCNDDQIVSATSGPILQFVDQAGTAANAVLAAPRANWVAVPNSTVNGFTRYAATFTINADPAATNLALEVIMQARNEAFATAFDWAYAQLEPGPVATPVELRPIATELALCHRYYQTSGIQPWVSTGSNIPIQGMHTFIPASSADEYSVSFPVELARLTSLNIKSTAHVALQARRTGGAVSNATVTVVGQNRKGFSFTTDKTETRTYAFAWEASGEL